MGHIFISYSKKDIVRAEKLIAALKREGFDPWVDVEGLEPGSQWRTRLEQQVKNCDAYLILISQNSKSSKWVLEELSVAQGFKKPIFPLRLDRTKPFFGLRTIQYEDIRGGKLPSESFYQELAKVTLRQKVTRRRKSIRTEKAKRQVVEGATQLLSYYVEELSSKSKDLLARATKGLTDRIKSIENSYATKNVSAKLKRTTVKKKNTVKKVPSSAKTTASKKKKKR